MKKVFSTYSMKSSFYWDSKLSESRKEEILKWVASLKQEELGCLEDILEDMREKCWEAVADAEGDCG